MNRLEEIIDVMEGYGYPVKQHSVAGVIEAMEGYGYPMTASYDSDPCLAIRESMEGYGYLFRDTLAQN